MNELKIKEYQLPKFEIIDYDKYLKLAKKDTEKYKNYVVTESSLSDDEKKRAELRKVAKTINSRRIEITNELKAPIDELKKKCDVIVNLYTETADSIDKQIKLFEQKEKNDRKIKAEEIYNNTIEDLKDLVSFEKVFNEKWLNKGYWKEDETSSKIESEINSLKEKVRNGLKTIEDLNSEFELELKNTFLEDFDITRAVFKNIQLQEQKEALKKADEKKEEIKQDKVNEMLTKKVKEDDVDPIKTYTLKITAKLSKQKQLKEFLDLNDMKYERI